MRTPIDRIALLLVIIGALNWLLVDCSNMTWLQAYSALHSVRSMLEMQLFTLLLELQDYIASVCFSEMHPSLTDLYRNPSIEPRT